jgi:hypothetical protein
MLTSSLRALAFPVCSRSDFNRERYFGSVDIKTVWLSQARKVFIDATECAESQPYDETFSIRRVVRDGAVRGGAGKLIAIMAGA